MLLKAVDRALLLLVAVGERGEMSVSEAATHLRVDRATASRLFSTLVTRGFVSPGRAKGRYRLGPEVVRLGQSYLERLDLRSLARPYLVQLQQLSGETAVLTIWDGRCAVYADKVESNQNLRTHATVGARAPLHAGATGKAILAFLPPDVRERIMANLDYVRFQPETIVDAVRLAEELGAIRERGYSTSREEIDAGTVAIGVPILGCHGVMGAVAVSGPLARLNDRLDEMARECLRVRYALARMLGGPATQTGPVDSLRHKTGGVQSWE